MKDNKVISTNQQIGYVGEKVFEAYVSQLCVELGVSENVAGAVFGVEQTRKFILKIFKIHQEEDLGVDFDAEVCWLIDEKYIPSGVHFLIQLKTYKKAPVLSTKDISYLTQQLLYGRDILIVWQSSKDMSKRKVLLFRDYYLNKDANSVPIINWQDFDSSFISSLIITYMYASAQKLINSVYTHALMYLKNALSSSISIITFQITKVSAGKVWFPCLIAERNSAKFMFYFDTDVSLSFPDLTIQTGLPNQISISKRDKETYKGGISELRKQCDIYFIFSWLNDKTALKKMNEAYNNMNTHFYKVSNLLAADQNIILDICEKIETKSK